MGDFIELKDINKDLGLGKSPHGEGENVTIISLNKGEISFAFPVCSVNNITDSENYRIADAPKLIKGSGLVNKILINNTKESELISIIDFPSMI
jgi:chemotaxis signal transduction protein